MTRLNREARETLRAAGLGPTAWAHRYGSAPSASTAVHPRSCATRSRSTCKTPDAP